MSKILLVDDDPFIRQIYRKRLLDRGFEVETAEDGLAALKALHRFRPDLMVLDLMMPYFNGFEVLKYIRSHAEMKQTRVIVLTNLYLYDDERKAAVAEADLALVKSGCTPALLIETIEKVLAGRAALPPRAAPEEKAGDAGEARMKREFLKEAPATLATLRQLNDAFVRSEEPATRDSRLVEFYQKVRYLSAMSALVGCGQIARLAGAFEALLLELHQKPAHLNPSTLQTIAYTLDFLRLLAAAAELPQTAPPTSSKALVVDDDPVATQALVAALRLANLTAVGTHEPLNALTMLQQEQYGLVLLDILMPELDGFGLCEKLRALPQYRRTPVIFVTAHADFDNRIHSVLSGGNDLIAKPVFPPELAVKAVTHLLRSQLPDPWGLA